MNSPITAHTFRERIGQPVDLAKLEASFVPPPHFVKASFESYIPDLDYPSQSAALSILRAYVHDIKLEHPNVLMRLLGKKPKKDLPHGLYLDGGFGVGKTHLLAAAFHAYHGKKAYLTFQELMFYVGLKRLDGAVASLSSLGLLIIDEFELDDPANTRIVTNLLDQLFVKGVHILTSSNTPPGALGEGKFSVEAFARELGQLTAHFQVVKVDGEDYRMTHPHASHGSRWDTAASSSHQVQVEFEFAELLSVLASAHPMRIRQSLQGIRSIAIEGVTSIHDPHHALRLVYFIDKIYDNDVDLWVSANIPMVELFEKRYFHGGDTKKFLRALSRLQELTTA
jgi:cell division protein ZapE